MGLSAAGILVVIYGPEQHREADEEMVQTLAQFWAENAQAGRLENYGYPRSTEDQWCVSSQYLNQDWTRNYKEMADYFIV